MSYIYIKGREVFKQGKYLFVLLQKVKIWQIQLSHKCRIFFCDGSVINSQIFTNLCFKFMMVEYYSHVYPSLQESYHKNPQKAIFIRKFTSFKKVQWLVKFGVAKWSSGDAAVKYRACARSEVKCATHARRHFTCRRHTSRTEGALIVPQGTLSSKKESFVR